MLTAEISKSYLIYCPLSRAHSAYWVVDLARFSRKAGWGCTGPPLGLGDGDGSVREGGDAVAAVEQREHQKESRIISTYLLACL